MTLLDAQQYDPAKERRHKIKIALICLGVLLLLILGWMYRNWPEEHVVDKFFTAIQKQNYETAYGIYFNGRRVGPSQVTQHLRGGWHERLWQRRRDGRRGHRQPARRTRPHVRAEIRQDADRLSVLTMM